MYFTIQNWGWSKDVLENILDLILNKFELKNK